MTIPVITAVIHSITRFKILNAVLSCICISILTAVPLPSSSTSPIYLLHAYHISYAPHRECTVAYLVRSIDLCTPVYEHLNYFKIAFLCSYHEGILMGRNTSNVVK
jgi:hypothetical protein